MTWDICVIDDSIPVTGELEVDDTASLNISTLKLLLEKNKWAEDPVRNLFNDLCSGSGNWNVVAFTNPSLYLQASEDLNYKPDIIIFDWDYPVVVGDITQILLKVVRNSFSLVYVYTHEDTEGEVAEELSKDCFDEFRDRRLFLLHKWDPEPEQTLLQIAQQKYEENFAFRFGRALRLSTGNAIEEILVGLGKGSIDFVLTLLNDEATQETDVKQLISQQVGAYLSGDSGLIEELRTRGLVEDKNAQALIELIRGRVESHISSLNFGFPMTEERADGDTSFPKEFWSNRLYYKPSDCVVRQADIVKNQEGNKFYLVFTPNCQLRALWDKCFGYISLIPAIDVSGDHSFLKDLFSLTRNPQRVNKIFQEFNQHSITEQNTRYLPKEPILLPFVDIDGTHNYFLLLPQAILSMEIPASTIDPEDDPGIRKNHFVTYDAWEGFERIATISEPFASSIVDHCTKSISGHGTPNYPKVIKDEITQFMSNTIDG
ncbi:MAG: hypothetical protein CEE38_14525 [Planctomycetes bacterium B3_Pla]|nr:MAG: hypothetical protein CEE38_14525 [Planctomycetes bacterium B3_Pla]